MTRTEMCLFIATITLIAAGHQAAAGPVKTTKLVTVKGVKIFPSLSTNPDPTFKLPVFQNTKFTFSQCCSQCGELTLTIRAGPKGAPVITYGDSATYPDWDRRRVTITTSPPAVTFVRYTDSKELFRLTADLRSFYSFPRLNAWSQAGALDSLNTVAEYAGNFVAAHKSCLGKQVPYSPNMRKVVAYLKSLAAAVKASYS